MATQKRTKDKTIDLKFIDEPAGRIRLELDEDKLTELANSIQAIGQLQAILVRPVKDRFEVVFGHRRLEACKRLGLSNIRATVRTLDDVQVALMRATENIERVDITPVEEAAIYKDLRDNHNLNLDQVAKKMGKSLSIVKRRLDLLKMPPCLQQAVHKKEIGYTVAEVLWSLGDIEDINYYLMFAIENGASRVVVEGWVKDVKDRKRRQVNPGEPGGGWQNPNDPRPIYVACDLCREAMEIGDETVIRACPNCSKAIEQAINGPTIQKGR